MNSRLFSYVFATWLCFLFACTVGRGQRTTGTSQIDSLQKEKAARNPIERKIDSQLLQAIKARSGQKEKKHTGPEPAKVNVNIDSNGDLLVDIDASVTDELLSSIKALGGKIIYPSKRYNTVRAQVPVSMVEKIAAREEVKFIKPAAIPVNNAS